MVHQCLLSGPVSTLIDSVIDAFPASAAFDVISDSLSSSDAERKEAIQKGKAVFGFTLKNKEGKEESWYIDLKDTGKVSKEAPKKADGMATSQEVQAWRFHSADLGDWQSLFRSPTTTLGSLCLARPMRKSCSCRAS
jgi:SCP-2 sterol transfer family